MNQNPNNNNDLDSLLEEFQNLSTPVENKEPIEEKSQVVQPVIQGQPTVPVQEVKPVMVNPVNVEREPVQTQSVVQAQPTVNSVQQPTPAPVMPNNNLDNIEESLVHPDMKVKLNDLDSPVSMEPVIPNIPEEPINNNGGKGNLIFMIVIFLIMAVFIFFIPKIDDFIKNKPGEESKPTPTASSTPTAKPVVKEVKTNCSIADVVNGDLTTTTSYNYQSLAGKVTKMKKTVVTKFANIEGVNQAAYNQTKLTCNSLATTYAGVTGYTVTCEEKDNVFTVVYAYDLNSFTNPTLITINGQQETIKSDVNLNDDIKTVKANMTSIGSTCK